MISIPGEPFSSLTLPANFDKVAGGVGGGHDAVIVYWPPGNPPPPTTCIAPSRVTSTFTGTLSGGSSIAFPGHQVSNVTFAGVAGRTVSIWAGSTTVDLMIAVLDTDGLTVLDRNDAFGNPFESPIGVANDPACITILLPHTGTYTIEVSNFSAGSLGPYWGYIWAGYDQMIQPSADHIGGIWAGHYAPQNQRLYLIRGFDGANGMLTCINASDNSIRFDVVIATASGGSLTSVLPTVFYNPNDSSVWVQTRDSNTGAGSLLRCNPNTGAILQTIVLPAPSGATTSAIFGTVFDPDRNLIYGYNTRFPFVSSTQFDMILVFDCTSKVFWTSLLLPQATYGFSFHGNNGRSMFYKSSNTTLYFPISTPSNGILKFNTSSAQPTASVTLVGSVATNVGGSGNYLPDINMLVGGDVATARVIGVDIDTGLILQAFNTAPNVRTDYAEWDPCLSLVNIMVPIGSYTDTVGGPAGNQAEQCVSFTRVSSAGVHNQMHIVEKGTLVSGWNGSNGFWPFMIWNPILSRMWVSEDNRIYTF